ncbi:MAG: V-type ATPase subunit subunit G family protein [Candidatus Methanosuratincola petrocarbonis]
MERVLTGLKRAEVVAEEIENEAKARANELVRRAEEEAKRLELESEQKAKEIGEEEYAKKISEAKKITEKIRKEGETSSAQLRKRAEEKRKACVDEVVEAVLKDLNP